jgi:hypothetical protein
MEVNLKPRMVRLETGTPKVIEDLLAALGDQYVVTHWHFWNWQDEARVTCLLVHASAIRQMQIAAGGQMPMRGH